jgi:hypothetical protein
MRFLMRRQKFDIFESLTLIFIKKNEIISLISLMSRQLFAKNAVRVLY